MVSSLDVMRSIVPSESLFFFPPTNCGGSSRLDVVFLARYVIHVIATQAIEARCYPTPDGLGLLLFLNCRSISHTRKPELNSRGSRSSNRRTL